VDSSSVLDRVSGRRESSSPRPGHLDQARPRLRRDVVFADIGDGVFLRYGGNGFVFKGNVAYRWVCALVPYLDGGHTVAELCEGLSGERRTMVMGIVQSLLDRGFARDAVPAEDVAVMAPVVERFRAQINYIDHYADDAHARFQRFRTARILVAGTGDVAIAAAASLLRNGLQTVYLASPDGLAAKPEMLSAEAAAVLRDGCQASVVMVKEPARGLSAADADGYDVVLAFGGTLGSVALLELTRQCAAAGPALLPAVTISRRAILGPLVRPGQSPCWVCAMLRMSANSEPAAIADLWRDASLGTLPGAASGPPPAVEQMIGNTLAFEAFRYCTGALTAETDDAIVVQDLDTLESARDTLLPHPCCPVCDSSQDEAIEATACLRAEGEELSEEETLRRQAALFGRYGGVFREYADFEITQTPVKVGSITLGPAGRIVTGTRTIAAFDLHSVFAARIRAFAVAATVYVDEVMTAPGAVAAVAAGPAGNGAEAAVAPGELATWSGLPDPGPGDLWVPARSLAHGALRYLPAAAVYPYAPVNQALVFEPTSAGAGCGVTVAEAVRQGLMSALADWAIRRAVSGRCAVTELPVLADGDKEIEFLLLAVRNLNREVRFYALAPEAPVSVVLAVSDRGGGDGGEATASVGHTDWSAGSALSLRDAIADALRDIVGTIQLSDEPVGHGWSPGGLTAAATPDFDPRTLRGATAGDSDFATRQRGTIEGVVGWLRSTGRDALVANTTTPDLRAAGFTTVRVVMTRE
jgi:bacteriocin biosynthesis cyclodehydratase domain-containing protein